MRELLAGLRANAFLTSLNSLPPLAPGDGLQVVLDRLSQAPCHAWPVVDVDGKFLGMVSLEEVYLASQSPHLKSLVVAADLMRADVTPLQPDDPLDRALELFVESDLLVLPLVEQGRILGVVKRSDLASAYLSKVQGQSEKADEARI